MESEEDRGEALEGLEAGVIVSIALGEEDSQNLAFLASRRYLQGKIDLATATGRKRLSGLLSHAIKVAAWAAAGEVSYGLTRKDG